jgi:hypothetical protein
VVRRALEVLEGLLLIQRERNFRSSRRSPWRSRISDPAVRFWYRFVQRDRSLLEQGFVGRTWDERVAPQLDGYMGMIFEQIARQAFLRRLDTLGLPPPVEWSRWEGQDRNRRSIEVDIVAELDDGRLLTGEVKWSSAPVDVDLHLGLRRDLEDLAASGQRWAADALDDDSAGHLYVSAAGFTDGFRRRAAEHGRIRLLDLEDLYQGVQPVG